jgi:hypothetical protein
MSAISQLDPASRNRYQELFGSLGEAGIRDGIGRSPFAQGLELGQGPYANYFFTHFNRGTTIPAGLTLTEEGTTTAAATYGIGLGGEATITSDDVAAKSDQLSTQLNWQVNRQPTGFPLIAEVRWKTGATITSSEYFVGITDAVADINLIALSSTSTFTTSTPTDGVYMGYSATPTSGAAFTSGGNQHVMISINNDTDSIVGVGGGAFVAATYYTYRFEIDPGTGDCRYYVNGTLLGTKTAAVRVNVPLGLCVVNIPRTTVSAVTTVDYMGIAGA